MYCYSAVPVELKPSSLSCHFLLRGPLVQCVRDQMTHLVHKLRSSSPTCLAIGNRKMPGRNVFRRFAQASWWELMPKDLHVWRELDSVAEFSVA